MSRRPPKDPRGGHARLYWAMLDSMAWRALSWADQGLYVAMRRKLNGSNNGNIEATLATLRHCGITSSASLAKGLRALMAVGLIARTREGHLSQGRKVCNLFRFTDEEVFEHPKLGIGKKTATNEWANVKTLAEAEQAIQVAHAAAKTGLPKVTKGALRPKSKNKASVHFLNRTGSKSELIGQKTSSATEHGGSHQVQKLNTGDDTPIHASPSQAKEKVV